MVSPPSRRAVRVALFMLFAMLLASCNVQLEVVIDVEENGSGAVTAALGLDIDAEEQVPNLEDFLVVDDLEATGWTVTPLAPREDSSSRWITASKPFASPDQLQGVLNELTGPNEMFKDFRITRTETDTATRILVEGTVDFTEGLDLFSDESLVPFLEDPPIGINIEELTDELGIADIGEAVQSNVLLRLPGEADGRNFVIGFGEERFISADVEDENRSAQLLGWVRLALLGLLILSLAIALAGWYLDWRARDEIPVRTAASVRERVPVAAGAAAAATAAAGSTRAGAGGAPAAGSVASAQRNKNRSLQLIVLDGQSVVFGNEDVGNRFVEFVRERGCLLSDDEIREQHQRATVGQLNNYELWERLGVPGDVDELDASFLADIKLRRGAKEFLREMRRREMPVAVISNDVAEWSSQLRALRGLNSLRPWVVSGDLGSRLPDPAVYEAVRRATGVEYSAWLVIGGDTDSLDVAQSLGAGTAWFTTRKRAGANPRHPVVESFGDFFRRRRSAAQPQQRRRR